MCLSIIASSLPHAYPSPQNWDVSLERDLHRQRGAFASFPIWDSEQLATEWLQQRNAGCTT